jgi:predicted transglutaminase-like cysteine proteinase
LSGKKLQPNIRTQFNQISQEINSAYTFVDWTKIYRKLTYWELELENAADSTLDEVLTMQKSQANGEFARFIKQNYPKWFADSYSG